VDPVGHAVAILGEEFQQLGFGVVDDDLSRRVEAGQDEVDDPGGDAAVEESADLVTRLTR
jgi:hypothetical protein